MALEKSIHGQIRPQRFPNGMTIAEFKKVVAEWPETDLQGNPAEVWMETSKGHSNQVKSVWWLNQGDMILEADIWKD